MVNTFPVEEIRKQFPILESTVDGKPLVYLDNAATTQKPVQVLDAVRHFYETIYSNIHRGVHTLSGQASEAYENSREAVREFLNATSHREIVFTFSTTDAINLIATSFGQAFIHAGDEILITEMEHHSNLLPWQALCERAGARLIVLPMDDQGELKMEKLPDLLSERTRLVAVAHVSNVLGTCNTITEIVKLAHEHDIPVLVDGAQAVQHMPVDVQALDCDFYVFSGHKCYAETGVGVLYAKEPWLERLSPSRFGGGMVTGVTHARSEYANPPFKFEAGTSNFVGAVSLHAAIEFMLDHELSQIEVYEQLLMDYAVEQLSALDDVTIYGGTESRHSALSFNLNAINAYDVGLILDKLGIAVRTGTHCAEPVMQHFGVDGMIRASFAIYNTVSEVDALIAGVKHAQRLLS